MDAKIFEYQIHKYFNRFTIMRKGLKAVYYLRWGKCIKLMRSKIKSLTGFYQVSNNCNIIALVKIIQGATFNFEKHTYI